MTLRLPSTSALRGLEAAARLKSFTAAAAELNLTQGAVSRQIRELEELLSVDLFVRGTRQIELTPAGAQYVAEVRLALQSLATAGERARTSTEKQTLKISILPTLASMWLMPRLTDFSKRNKGIALRFKTSTDPARELRTEGAVALRVGKLPGQQFRTASPRVTLRMIDSWDGVSADFLFRDRLVPIASPKLFRGEIPAEPRDIIRYPLIHTGTRMNAWGDWLGIQGVSVPPAEIVFGHMFMSISAAKDGAGIALVPDVLIDRADPDLVMLSKQQIESEGGYYLLVHESNALNPAVSQFRSWVLSYAAETRRQLERERLPVAM